MALPRFLLLAVFKIGAAHRWGDLRILADGKVFVGYHRAPLLGVCGPDHWSPNRCGGCHHAPSCSREGLGTHRGPPRGEWIQRPQLEVTGQTPPGNAVGRRTLSGITTWRRKAQAQFLYIGSRQNAAFHKEHSKCGPQRGRCGGETLGLVLRALLLLFPDAAGPWAEAWVTEPGYGCSPGPPWAPPHPKPHQLLLHGLLLHSGSF